MLDPRVAMMIFFLILLLFVQEGVCVDVNESVACNPRTAQRQEKVFAVVSEAEVALPKKVVPLINPSVARHEVLVQYKRLSGECCQVRWDIYGMKYNEAHSMEFVLESYLLRGNGNNLFCSEEIRFFLAEYLRDCLRTQQRVSFDQLGRYAPLEVEDVRVMFLLRSRIWEVNVVEDDAYFGPNCIRLCFAMGTLTGYDVSADRCDAVLKSHVGRNCLLSVKNQEEQEAPFIHKLFTMAQEEKQKIQATSSEIITIRFVTLSGAERGIVWDARDVKDGDRKITSFLQDMVLQGTSLGVWDDTVRHFSFENSHISHALRTDLIGCLRKKCCVSSCGDLAPLERDDLIVMPNFLWTVVPDGKACRPKSVSCFITFGQYSLEGVPDIFPYNGRGTLSSRNFLLALERDNVVDGVCPKMFWRRPERVFAVKTPA